MEVDLGIPSALYAAPVREIVELGKSQISFINMFAIPLFQGVTDVMPNMVFCVNELHTNKTAWEARIEQETARDRVDSLAVDSMFSPTTITLESSSGVSTPRKSSVVPPLQRVQKLLNQEKAIGMNKVSETTPNAHSSLESSPQSSSSSMPTSAASPNGVVSNGLSPQPQVSPTNASAPSSLDHTANGEAHVARDDTRGVAGVQAYSIKSPSTESEVLTNEASISGSDRYRHSDITDYSGVAHRDSGSQGTTGTTSKLPLSPSTKGTSITSDDSHEKNGTSQTPTLGTPSTSEKRRTSAQTSTAASEESPPYEGKGVLMETVHRLRKRPSRFRMNSLHFWKRSKSQSPPMPAGNMEGQVVGGSDDNFGWSDAAR